MVNYTVFDGGRTIQGDARTLLEQIRAENARENPEIAAMNVDQYARAMIEDAPFFLPQELLEALQAQAFDSDHDRALAYLSQVPTSGVRILVAR